MGFIACEQLLDLEIQYAGRSKEEVENWRQRTRHPSVTVRFREPSQDPKGNLRKVFSCLLALSD